jgi:fatty acid desaturase
VYRHRRDLLREHPPEDLTSLLGEQAVNAREPEPERAKARRANRLLVVALCGRTAVIVAAALLLPWPVAVLAAIVAEIVLIMLIMTLTP